MRRRKKPDPSPGPHRPRAAAAPGPAGRATHDYVRHGTTTLFAALEVATGRVTDACYDRHTHDEFLAFLKKVARAYPRRQLHVVVDNYATHSHPDVEAWLAKNPRINLHFTPTSGSWMNLVEVFFSIITRQAIRRGTFRSVPELIAAIRRFFDGWNDHCRPFTWTKTADEILSHARKGTSDALTLAFISERMRMSHVYQPLLIKTLVAAGGTATLRQVAMAFLMEDESQIAFYERRIQDMPLPVLKRHGVVRRDGDLLSREVPTLSYQQAAALRALCERRIGDFLESRGVSPWDYRLLEVDPVPTSTRYAVLKRAGGRCQLCHTNERPLHVDHITPRSKGGANELTNLQALCSDCNLGKLNKDATGFRPGQGLTL